MADTDARVPALQLLLAELPDDVKRKLIYEAFPHTFLILRMDGDRLVQLIQEARHEVSQAASIVDGSSGIGVLAAKNVKRHLDNAHGKFGTIAGIIGVAVQQNDRHYPKR